MTAVLVIGVVALMLIVVTAAMGQGERRVARRRSNADSAVGGVWFPGGDAGGSTDCGGSDSGGSCDGGA